MKHVYEALHDLGEQLRRERKRADDAEAMVLRLQMACGASSAPDAYTGNPGTGEAK